MPISFECPHCHTTMNVGDQFAGTTGPCRNCGQPITIPGEPPVAAISPAEAPPAKSSSTGLILAILGACALVGFCVIAIPLALLLPAVEAAREAARRNTCVNNQRQIAIALLNYESVHGELPPAFVADENGNPMHSWRVLILPFLEGQVIHDQYNFDEPWNSPANSAATQQMPEVYRCPSDSTNTATDTSYFVVSDPASMFPGSRPRKIRDIIDGTANTVAVVEASGVGVHWAEPTDLSMNELHQIVSDHAGDLVVVAFADGHTQAVPVVEPAMVTAASGD